MANRSRFCAFVIPILALMAAPAFAAPTVLLLQEQNPCGDSSTQQVLEGWGIEYRVASAVPTVTRLEKYSTIIVSSHQSWSFYESLAARMPRINKWLRAGARTLEFHAASGCAEMNYSLTLPRGVQPSSLKWNYDTNTVRLPRNPLVAGVPTQFGPYHDAIWTTDHTFTPLGKSVIVDSEGQPTLIDYCVGGSGRVIAVGLPVERFYSDQLDSASLLTNMLSASVYTPGCQSNPQ